MPPSFPPQYILVDPRSGESPISFQSGEILCGTVIDPVDPLHTLIRIKGEEIQVENRGGPLSRGSELALEVEKVHPKVILKIISEESLPGARIESWLTKYLSSDWPLEKLAKQLDGLWRIPPETIPPEVQDVLKQLLSRLTGFSFLPSAFDPAALEKIVVQSGLFWETKLKRFIENPRKDSFDSLWGKDLKSLLLKLKSEFDSLIKQNRIPDSSAMGALAKSLGQYVDKIELYQILNARHADWPENSLIFFPLWVHNDLQFVEMNFTFPRQGAETSAKEEFSLLFLLHLPDWGRMRIEVRVKGKALYCSFTVSDPEGKEILDRALPELTARLLQIGYEALSHVSLEKAEKISPSLIPEMQIWLKSFFNVVV